MEKNSTSKSPNTKTHKKWLIWLSWGLTAILVAVLVSILYWQPILAQQLTEKSTEGSFTSVDFTSEISSDALASMPYFEIPPQEELLNRNPETQTIAPTRPRSEPVDYEVELGDAVFSIAQKYNITPETLLWSNYDVLKDDPHSLSVGQILRIPPTNGILYDWEEGDTLDKVAADFKTDVDNILNWSGNHLDLTDPQIEAGEVIMIPGGQRAFQQWVVPTYAVGKSGTNASLPGGCTVNGPGLYGGGFFIWPSDNHYLSGNDFWSGHLAIDIATPTGAPIYAADSGVVVFAGWDSNGYGNVVMIDHQNGYHTLYAHLSGLGTSCGSNVVQGSVIGYAGSTGNSTGPHLHFEVRYLGGFLNPWTVLP